MFWAPILWGAGMGALGSLLTGNDPIKGAAVGAGTGGLLGGLPAGAWGGGAAEVAGSTAPNLAANVAPIALDASATMPTAVDIGSGFGYADGLGSTASYLPAEQAAGYTASATALPVTSGSAYMNPYTGMYESPYEAGGIIGNTNFNPVKNIGYTSDTTPFFSGNTALSGMEVPEETMWEKIKPYANIQNLAGASSIYNQFNQPTRMPAPQSGRVTEGKAPQGNDVMELLKTIKQPERKRISLL